jgi:radical SAM protein with 4Fe4S-binding SPASM domain
MIQIENTFVQDETVQLKFKIKNARPLSKLNMFYSLYSHDECVLHENISEINNNYISIEIPASIHLIPGKTKLCISFKAGETEGIYGQWDYSENGFKKNQYIEPYPSRMIGLSLTNTCNLQCSMCWQQDRKEKHFLSLEAIKNTIDSIALMGRPPVYLWGGEPLMHPKIWEIVSYLKSRFFFTIINTNGYLLQNNIDEILKQKVDMLIISIDGLEETHNQIRGSNKAYIRLIEAIKKIQTNKSRRPIITINCVINEYNYKKLKDLVVLKQELKAEYLEFQFMMFYSKQEKLQYKNILHNGFQSEAKSIKYYPEKQELDLDILIAEIDKIKALEDDHIRFFPYALNSNDKIRDYYSNPQKININKCSGLTKSIWIEPNGDIVPCSCFPDYSIGNINQHNFFELWNNNKFISFRQKLDNALFPICFRCCDFYKTDFFQTI